MNELILCMIPFLFYCAMYGIPIPWVDILMLGLVIWSKLRKERPSAESCMRDAAMMLARVTMFVERIQG